MELVSRCVECGLAEPESLASPGGSAPGVVDGILSPAHATPVAITSALQGSIAAVNVMHFILLELKTIFHHHAKFHQRMGPKNDPSMITHMSGKLKN